MERRTTKRKLTETKVFLHHPALPTTACSTRDLSKDGVFVITSVAASVPENERLKMTFAVDLGNLTRLYDFQVTVIRRTSEGLALAIDRTDPSSTRAMPKQVKSRHPGKILPLTRRTEAGPPTDLPR